MPKDVKWEDLDKGRFYFYQPMGSLIVRAIVFPPNLVKTRLQAPRTPGEVPYKGTIDAFRTIIRTEGFFTLYRGFFAGLWNMLFGPVYLTVYEVMRAKLDPMIVRSTLLADYKIHPDIGLYIGGSIAGVAASAAGLCVSVPGDVVTNRLMVQRKTTPGARVSAWTVVRNVVQAEGAMGLYKGYFASVIAQAPFSGIAWFTFYGVGDILRRTVLRDPHVPDAPIEEGYGVTWRYALSIPIAGGTAGAVAGLLTNPLDALRVRIQLTSRKMSEQSTGTLAPRMSLREAWNEIKREHGVWRGLTVGATARVAATGVTFTMIMSGIEALKRLSAR